MLKDQKIRRIVIFASGEGSNAQHIIRYFKAGNVAEVTLVLSDRKAARALDKAKELGVPAKSFPKADLYENDSIYQTLITENPDLIVLAGFLKLLPKKIIDHFSKKIINIHPALLPKYGGKGMYGMKVHEAVYANKEIETGITIHFVNEHFDEGEIILQKTVRLLPTDKPVDIAKKIGELEREWFPLAIEKLLKEQG